MELTGLGLAAPAEELDGSRGPQGAGEYPTRRYPIAGIALETRV